MSRPRPRITIGRLMIVVAASAGLAACARVPILAELMAAMAPAAIFAGLAFGVAIWLAGPGRRLRVAAWLAALWPLSIPASLNAGYAVARLLLGRPLGPPDHGSWVGLLEASVFFFMLSSAISTAAVPVLAILGRGKPAAIAGHAVVVPSLVWASVILIWHWDPLRAAWWFID